MTCWIAIPIKEPGACKTRLRAVLGDAEREHLAGAMLHHVLTVTRNVGGRVLLIAPAGHDVPAEIERISDRRRGLNGELTGLTVAAAASDVDRLVIVPADLPLIVASDMRALTDLPRGNAAIASDRAQLGTNALSLPLPAARDFRFQFGHTSFERHCAEAARLNMPLTTVRSDRLAFDIDEPADLIDLLEQYPDIGQAMLHSDRRWTEAGRHLEAGGVVGSN
jgi:2-phospho-L-lactate guanylyltransferase